MSSSDALLATLSTFQFPQCHLHHETVDQETGELLPICPAPVIQNRPACAHASGAVSLLKETIRDAVMEDLIDVDAADRLTERLDIVVTEIRELDVACAHTAREYAADRQKHDNETADIRSAHDDCVRQIESLVMELKATIENNVFLAR